MTLHLYRTLPRNRRDINALNRRHDRRIWRRRLAQARRLFRFDFWSFLGLPERGW